MLALVVGAVNIVTMEVYKASVLQALPSFSACSGTAGTAASCFTKLLNAIPFVVVFPLWVGGIFFGLVYGIYYDFLPGRGYFVRAMGLSVAMLIVELIIGVRGITIVASQNPPVVGAQFVMTLGYAALLARLYRGYTREVRFESPDPKKLKVSVDGRNYTGKVKTLGFRSTHKISAASEGPKFHAWLVSGGVSVTDPKSSETTMKVDGDGLLKVS